jgi:hypothetical protein
MKKRSDRYVSARLSTLLFLYISQVPTCCREYVREIYELEYYYHPPILFLFPFHFFLFFIFHFTLYQLLSMRLFVILSKYIHMRSCFEEFIK